MQYNLNKYLFFLSLLLYSSQSLLANELFRDIGNGVSHLLVDYRYYVFYTPLPIATLKEPDFVKQAVLQSLVQNELTKHGVPLRSSSNDKNELYFRSLNTLSNLSNDCNSHYNNVALKRKYNIEYNNRAIDNMLKCIKEYNLSIGNMNLSTLYSEHLFIYVEIRKYMPHVGCAIGQLFPLSPGFARMFIYKIYVLDVETQKIIWFNGDYMDGGWIKDVNHKSNVHALFTQNLLEKKDED